MPYSGLPRLARAVCGSLVALALLTGTAALPAAAGTASHPTVVDDQPVDWTPHVLNGTVNAVAQFGDTVVVGGDFTEVTDPREQRVYDRGHLFAFERGTGRIHTGFAPELDGPVTSLVAARDGVIVGGSFTTVNGARQRGLTKLDPASGDRVPDFAAATLDNGWVNRMAASGRSLYVGGTFTAVNGTPRTGLARLDVGDGAVDPDFDIAIGESRNGPLRVQELALRPQGDRLVVNGNFTEVDGHRRDQIAMVDVGGEGRVTEWSTRAFAEDCGFDRLYTYMQQMDFAPDGSYFVVVTSGGPNRRPGLCKTASRWEVSDAADSEPTWVNHTGGDSLYSVEATGAAVYVGGHQRWLDNPQGHKSPGPGAVERRGIGAIDPESGRALPWNPGRTRGHGVQALVATDAGLYVGSDTDRLAGRYRARLGMFPLP